MPNCGPTTRTLKTLGEFIIEKRQDFPHASGELSTLLASIKYASKVVNREINKAGLCNILGDADGQSNIQGEVQQKLDVYANEKFKAALQARGLVCGVASEEEDEVVLFDHGMNPESKYVVLMDPLDGSSNIDVNVSVGTIFSIYRRISEIGTEPVLADFLQSGRHQVAAGYVIYGSSTMLVYSTGNGVNGFTYDPSLGVYGLSHPDLRIPKAGQIYSINEGNYSKFPLGVKKYIKYCQENAPQERRPYTSRYIGSLVSDFHRNLLKGGIYLYPSTQSHPNGKLRLLYECNPMAFLIEQAGGLASDGHRNILDIAPTELHQRVPFFVGSPDMVNKVIEFLETYKD